MSQIILILTQALKNKSVEMLADSLRESDKEVLIWEVHPQTIKLSERGIQYTPSDKSASIFIDYDDLHLVIKRTWGPIRDFALSVCKSLEEKHVAILNGCKFIEWSHSKIQQYLAFENTGIMPKSICLSADAIAKNYLIPAGELIDILNQLILEQLNYPVILKTDRGCRGDGIYLIDSKNALNELIQTEKFSKIFEGGVILQQFIETNLDREISNYYRINLVNMHPVSAVKFNLIWEVDPSSGVKRLIDADEIQDFPVSVSLFNNINKLIAACPYEHEVSGIDVVMDLNGNLLLLEFNDGPAISLITELGQRDLHHSERSSEAAQCANFGVMIAEACLEKIGHLHLRTHAF